MGLAVLMGTAALATPQGRASTRTAARKIFKAHAARVQYFPGPDDRIDMSGLNGTAGESVDDSDAADNNLSGFVATRLPPGTHIPGPSELRNRFPVQTGMASWYAAGRNAGTRTAVGETMNDDAMTAAHRTLPFGTRLLVHAPRTGRSIIVRVNDRGPYSKHRILDLSRAAAQRLGILSAGVAQVTIRVIPRDLVKRRPLLRDAGMMAEQDPQSEVASLPR
ncbi:septal ring lytic transglycosylase RlpA family protein [Oecophyllibacter saccharovorans]|nr:septal ring lytic transglycosylase RlpA family protein [Oecophyllibacter saccharovorans]